MGGTQTLYIYIYIYAHTSALMVSLGVRFEAKVNSTVSSVGVGAVSERRERSLLGQLAHEVIEITNN